MPSIKIGDIIGQRFKVKRILGGEGKSGMGVVFYCFDKKFERIIALKTVQGQFISSKDSLTNFKREALAWVSLGRHPNIVQAHFFQEFEERPYIILEYIVPDRLGRNTLTQYLQGNLSQKQIAIWSIQFCRGMEYAVSRGVTPHRDIKPDNLLISREGILKITDFGLAVLLDSAIYLKNQDENVIDPSSDINLRSGNVLNISASNNFIEDIQSQKLAIGTLPWMAPEQFQGYADARSDIYAFGIVLYQMVSHGSLPFSCHSKTEYYETHQHHPVPLLESKLFPIIQRCTQKDPQNRFQSFKELQLALEELYIEEIRSTNSVTANEDLELDANGYNNKGVAFEFLGLPEKAQEEYQNAIRKDPYNARAHYNLGNIMKAKKRFDDAIVLYSRAIELMPNHSASHNNLGIILFQKGLLDEAMQQYRLAIYCDDKNLASYDNIGLIFSLRKQYSKAIHIYKRALRIMPDFNVARLHLALTLMDLKKFFDAIKEFRKLLQGEADPIHVHYFRGLIHKARGAPDVAIKEWKKVLQLDSSCNYARFEMGEQYEKMGLKNKALHIYKNALKIDGADGIAMGKIGIAYYKLGKLEKSIKFLRNSVNLNPNDYLAYITLGEALYRQGLLKEALKAFKVAKYINPKCKIPKKT